MLGLTRQGLLGLAFSGVALASMEPWFEDTIVGRDLEVRQNDNSKCNPNGYKSVNGLNFTTYCGQNNPFNDALKPFKMDSMADCMEHCSRYWGDGEGCFGVVWIEDNGDCWLRNSTTGTANLVKKEGHYSALVVDGEMNGYDTKCPAEDASTQTLSGVDGLGYTVNCNKVISGFDGCFSGMQNKCLDNPYKGFFHTETLEECLRICVDQHPLCKAVSWSPDLKIGFANCWPKTGFPESGLSSPGAKQGVLHSATITRIDPINRECPSSKSYTSTNKKSKFDIHCGQVSTGTNMTIIHAQNITSCMESCATSEQKCVGVVFDSQLNGGFKNCYLQNTTNTVSDLASATYAALSSNDNSNNGNGNGNGNNSNDSSSSSSSKAWIAGPVIGGLALLFAIAFAIFFFRRRKARAAGVAPVEKDGSTAAYGPAPAYSPGEAPHGAVNGYYDAPPMELHGNGAQANELPASTKYAQEHSRATATELP